MPRPVMYYGEVITWLVSEGMKKGHVVKLIANGTITGTKLSGWTLYSRKQIQDDVLNPLNAEGPASTTGKAP